MQCPLCNATNEPTALICHVCGEDLSPKSSPPPETPAPVSVSIESVDLTKKPVSKKNLMIVALALMLTLIPWAFMYDLLKAPEATLVSRKAFAKALENYSNKKETWDQQKENILSQMQEQRKNKEMGKTQLSFNALPIEVLVSFVVNDLGFSKGLLENSSLYLDPTDPKLSTFILSKYEQGSWPLKILLSLKIALSEKNGAIHVDFTHFQRGKREVNQELVWEYFLPELQSLRTLESYFGGIQNFYVSETQNSSHGSKELQVTWNYSHPDFFPERLPVN